MGKYYVKWRRIWEFEEQIESETEKEVYEKIFKERATAGSTIEIDNVTLIDLEEVKQEAKEEEETEEDKAIAIKGHYKEHRGGEMERVIPRKKKEKK